MNAIKSIITSKMNRFIAIFTTAIMSAVCLAAVGGIASAHVQYDPNGTPSTKTPVFNTFYDVPSGVGDEADFVRVKPLAGTNGDYKDTLDSDCTAGSQYNVRTYIHNGADPKYNEASATEAATAIAHDTVVAMNAPTNTTAKKFVFKSTVSASNAASVSDTGTLNCGSDVVLTLVPMSVQTYSKTLGFQGAADSAVNGTLKIGSRVQGSGDQYACWDDRITVVYAVKVEAKPVTQKVPATCDLLDVTTDGKLAVIVRKLNFTAHDATVTGVSVNFGDNKAPVVLTQAQLPYTYTYATAGDYSIRATVKTNLGDVTAAACVASITTSKPVPPKPPVTPPVVKSIPNTGAGSVVGIFAGITLAGAVAHNILARRSARR